MCDASQCDALLMLTGCGCHRHYTRAAQALHTNVNKSNLIYVYSTIFVYVWFPVFV